MIAGIKCTVVFYSYAFAADLAKDAHIPVNTHLLGNSAFKVIDKGPADIVLIPFIKDITEKNPVIIRVN